MKNLYEMFCDHWIEKPKEEFKKPINYVMAKNGCFEIRDTPVGRCTVRADEIVGLETELKEGVELTIPPIPGSILSTIIHFFRAVYEQKDEAEAFLQVFYNPEEAEYFLHCPRQKVSGAMVQFERSPELESQYLLVMDIHSHNSMPAFFSITDDKDEQEDRLYGVVGCLNQHIPQMEFRMGIAGRFIKLDGRDLFTKPEPPQPWPQSWLDRCHISHAPRHRKYLKTSSPRYPYYRRDPRWGDEWEEIFTETGGWTEKAVFTRQRTTKKSWLI